VFMESVATFLVLRSTSSPSFVLEPSPVMPIGLSACRAEVDGITVVTSHIPFSRQGLISFQAKDF
jgi:hypothetical protein